jgi:hypothetical protein
VRNGGFEFSLRNISIHARKVLLHAVNLRHGTDGFTSPPKEVVLRIFITFRKTLLSPNLTGRGDKYLPDYTASHTVKRYLRFYSCENLKSLPLFCFFLLQIGEESARLPYMP